MIVYVVQECFEYEGCTAVDVYLIEEDAKIFCDTANAQIKASKYGHGRSFEYLEREVIE